MIKVSIDSQEMQNLLSGVADQLKNKIDLNHVKKICKKRYGIETINDIEHKKANIVVVDNQAACKLDFDVRFPMSILISANEDSNSTLTEPDDMPQELDHIPEEIDDVLEEDLDDIPDDIDDLLEEDLDDIPDDIEEIQAELIKLEKRKK